MNRKSGSARAPNKRYVQFSKVIVVAVTAAVTLTCGAGMWLCFALANTEGIVELGKAYISYAIVAFAAYSGNSAVEKWLIRRYTGSTDNSTDEEASCG